jgi:hypothetical protein
VVINVEREVEVEIDIGRCTNGGRDRGAERKSHVKMHRKVLAKAAVYYLPFCSVLVLD